MGYVRVCMCVYVLWVCVCVCVRGCCGDTDVEERDVVGLCARVDGGKSLQINWDT